MLQPILHVSTIGHGSGDFRFGGEHTVNVSPTFHLPQFQLVADEAAFQIQTVAGEDRTAEADLFEPGEEEELPGGLARIETMQHQQAASLRQSFQ